MSWSCIICTDLCDTTKSLASVPCGHIFHQQCLNQWLTEALTCPTCRSPCSAASTVRLYPTVAVASENNQATERNLVAAKTEIRQKNQEISLLRSQNEQLTLFVSKAESDSATLHQKNLEVLSKYEHAVLKIREMKKVQDQVQRLESLCTQQYTELQLYKNISKIVLERKQDVENMVNAEYLYAVSNDNMPITVRKFATYISFLKYEFDKLTERKNELFLEVQSLKNSNATVSQRYKKYKALSEKLQQQIDSLTQVENVAASNSAQAKTSINDIAQDLQNRFCATESDLDNSSLNVNFGDNSKKIRVVVLDESEVPTSSAFKNEVHLPVIPKSEPLEGSVTRIGYDGLGGHRSVVIKSEPKLIRRMVEKKAAKFATINCRRDSLRKKDIV